jgi:hypothetical protein
MAPRRPDVRNTKKQQRKRKNSQLDKQNAARKRDEAKTNAYLKHTRRLPIPEGERQAMFNSLTHFLRSKDDKKKEGLYRLLQNQQPALFQKLSKGESIATAELSDETVRGISQIIYERDLAPDVAQVPQPEISDEIRQFNNQHIKKLSPIKYDELCQLCRTSVPSLLLDGGQRPVKAGKLPDGVQIMVYRYLQKNLSPDVQAQTQPRIRQTAPDEDEAPVEDEIDWWEDIILDYLKEKEDEKRNAGV